MQIVLGVNEMITMDDIVRDYHPTIREQTKKISFPLNNEIRKLADDMIEFIKNSQDPEISDKYDLRPGVGVAAPQLDIPIQMFAVHIPAEDEDPISQIMINPRIVRHSVKQTALPDGEGCLSIDDVYEGLVPRHKRITVEYYDVDGEKHTEKFKGYPSIVVQHEMDHLSGILFYDHINEDNPFEVTSNLELLED